MHTYKNRPKAGDLARQSLDSMVNISDMVESRISWRTPSFTIQRRGTKQRDRRSIPFTGADDVGCTIGNLLLAIKLRFHFGTELYPLSNAICEL
jgi:hypothetical protein